MPTTQPDDLDDAMVFLGLRGTGGLPAGRMGIMAKLASLGGLARWDKVAACTSLTA